MQVAHSLCRVVGKKHDTEILDNLSRWSKAIHINQWKRHVSSLRKPCKGNGLPCPPTKIYNRKNLQTNDRLLNIVIAPENTLLHTLQ